MRTHEFPDASAARKKYPHGTYARYRLGKCRCDRCRKAVREYERARQARNRPDWEIRYSPSGGHYVVRHKQTGVIHARPKTKGEAQRILSTLNVAPASPNTLVDARPVCEHVALLREFGVGLKTIAEVARVSRTVLTAIVAGEITRTRQRMVDKILAVTTDAIPSGMRVRADASVLLIERMVAAGFTRSWIRKELGYSATGIPIAKHRHVTVATARRVERVYEKAAAQCLGLPPIPAIRLEGQPIRVQTQRMLLGTIERRHGTTSAFDDGCRCPDCVSWHNQVESARNARTALRYIIRGRAGCWAVRDLTSDTVVMRTSARETAIETRDALNVNDEHAVRAVRVDARPAQEHIATLRARGLSDRDIAIAAGLKPGTVFTARQPGRKQILLRTSQAILGVGTEAAGSGLVMVESADTHAMLERLLAVGFDRGWLTLVLGHGIDGLSNGAKKTRLAHARSVAALYSTLRERVGALRAVEERLTCVSACAGATAGAA